MVISQTLGTHGKEIKEKSFFLLDLLFMKHGAYQSNLVVIGQPLYRLTIPCNLAE
ncbi:MAG: hypothetical protein J7K02_03185 [Deltaproteobacteria bacterium]|nr:hypothetical protein [Deltaproteobacteria bacterium]